jgi:hypothetical protein
MDIETAMYILSVVDKDKRKSWHWHFVMQGASAYCDGKIMNPYRESGDGLKRGEKARHNAWQRGYNRAKEISMGIPVEKLEMKPEGE